MQNERAIMIKVHEIGCEAIALSRIQFSKQSKR